MKIAKYVTNIEEMINALQHADDDKKIIVENNNRIVIICELKKKHYQS